jgi:hypothetical protein
MVDGICRGEDVTTGDISVEASFQKRSAFASAGAVNLTQGFDGVGGGLTGGESDDVAWFVRLNHSITQSPTSNALHTIGLMKGMKVVCTAAGDKRKLGANLRI